MPRPGYDTSPESFANEALRVLIATKITPNIVVGYGSWVCDNFVRKASLMPRNLNCKQRNDSSLSAEERKAACDNIVDDVKDNNMGPNMQILAQEEVEIGLEDAWGHMFHRFNDTGNEVAWAESNKAVLFQTIYTMAAIQKHVHSTSTPLPAASQSNPIACTHTDILPLATTATTDTTHQPTNPPTN